jgi:hypothetical protein
MRQVVIAGLMLGAAVTGLAQTLDVARMAQTYKSYDTAHRGGMGYCDTADSSNLGWGEGGIITSYINMWEATEDTYWLGKISEHFHQIMASASDVEDDGYLSWYTTAYSTAIAWAERLHNVSNAEVGPEMQRIMDGKAANRCTGHTYLIDFAESPERFRVIDWDIREVITDGVEYDGTEIEITQIEPFTFEISGATHQGDRFLIRTMAPEPTRYAVHQGLFLYPVARFIEIVEQRSELHEQYGDEAREFLQFINRNVFEMHERNWLDMGELGGTYRNEPKLTERAPNRVLPHNQYAELARVWLVLQDVEGAHPLMAQRAEQMVRYFKNHVYLDEESDAYYWRYSNWIEFGEPGHYFAADRYETTGYGNIDVKLVVEAARRGILFTDEDMQRFVNTWLRVMWNQDEDNPRMAERVDGTGAFRSSPLATGWAQLSQWDPKVYELALKTFEIGPEENQAALIPTILLSAARAGFLYTP